MIVIISYWEMPKMKHIETDGQTVAVQWTLALEFMAQCAYKSPCASKSPQLKQRSFSCA